MTMRWLSISLTFRRATSVRRALDGIESREQDVLKRSLGGIDQTRDLLLAEDLRKMQYLLRDRGVSAALQPRFKTWM